MCCFESGTQVGQRVGQVSRFAVPLSNRPDPDKTAIEVGSLSHSGSRVGHPHDPHRDGVCCMYMTLSVPLSHSELNRTTSARTREARTGIPL